MNIKKYNHPVLFYIFSSLLPLFCWAIAGHFSHISPSRELYVFITSGMALMGLLMPFLISLLIMVPDKELRNDLLGRFFNFKGIKAKYWLITFLLMLASILLAQAVSLAFGYSVDQFKFAGSFSFVSGVFPVWFLLIMAPTFEELGWHAYGIDCLRPRFNLFTLSIIFAVYWGLWHLPLSFIKDYYHSNLVESGVLYSVNFLVSMIPFTLIMNWLYYKTNRNIIVTIIFHITAGYFNEIFQTHPISKVIQTVLLIILSVILILNDKEFFFGKYDDSKYDNTQLIKN